MPAKSRQIPPPPDRSELADRLHSAAIHLLRRLRRVDEATGLTAPRLSALSVLVFGRPRSLTALAAAEQVRPPTMTRLVRQLEAERLVRRTRDPVDGRAIRLRATAKGARLLLRGRGRRVEHLATMLGGASADELHSLRRAVAALERLLQSAE
ncbi:MAG: MarR family transcriptional regulator [Phycisphaerae bacterium]